jgi:GT2 family glycosyltransferase
MPALRALARLRGLYERYAAAHLLVARPGGALAPGLTVDRIARRGTRTEVAGRCAEPGARLAVHCGDEAMPAAVTQASPDPAGGGARFALDLPATAARLTLACIGPDGAATHHPLPAIPPAAIAWARAALVPGFLARLAAAAPLILRFAVTRADSLRGPIRRRLGLVTAPLPGLLDARLFDAPPPPPADAPAITIVLPVYNAPDLLSEALARITAGTDLPWHLIAIDDASPDPRVAPVLAAFAAAHPGQVTLMANRVNEGFVGTANRGLAAALDRGGAGPVVLLNADALVPPGWASRLVAPLLADPMVASVTPMSNDAEIFTIPASCAPAPLPPAVRDRALAAADALAAGLGPATEAAVPTGMGFCMAIARRWLERVPAFDTAFSPGYGEEVDWCRKTRALGARHVGTARLAVAHAGSGSFGDARKAALRARHGALISARYPAYDAEVQAVLARDPLLTPRLALGLAYAAGAAATEGAPPLPVWLAHSMGGGVDHYLEGAIAAALAGPGAAAVLRVGGARRWRLALHGPGGGMTEGETDDFALVRRLLAPFGPRRVIYACGVGDPDPVTLPDHLLALAEPGRDRIEVELHDYFPLSPSFTLLGADGRFAGLPPPDSRDPAHTARRPDGTPVPLADWRAAWRRLIARADRITAFSAASAAHLVAVWPDAAGRIAVSPHVLHTPVPRIDPVPGAVAIGVLGHVNRQKGAALVRTIARLPGAPPVVVLGEADPADPPGPPVTVHGGYRIADLPHLVRRYRIAAWLVPAVWPETFSFVTHESLATGLPVVCLDLGAQAEAVRAAGPQGRVVSLDPDPAAQARRVLAALADLRAATARGAP